MVVFGVGISLFEMVDIVMVLSIVVRWWYWLDGVGNVIVTNGDGHMISVFITLI